MNHPQIRLISSFCLLATILLNAGCSATAPTKVAEAGGIPQEKSVQELADEAMRTSGKLSPAQINALIRANAKCTPHDPQYNRT